MVDAAHAAGVSRFVFISGTRPAIVGRLPAIFQCKAEAEHHLEASGLDYTILACDAFMEVWLAMMGSSIPVVPVEPGLRHTLERPFGFGHKFYVSMRHDIEEKGMANINGAGRSRIAYVATEDVARLAVDSLDNPACHRAKLEVGNQPLSQVEVADIFSKVLDRPIRLKKTPVAILRMIAHMVGLFDRPAGDLIAASALAASVDSEIDTTRLYNAFPGLHLQSVEEFLLGRVKRLPAKMKTARQVPRGSR